MTYKQLTDRVLHTLGMQEDTTAPEKPYVQDLIFEGICDLSARTRAGVRVINLNLTANVAVHDMSTAIIALLDLEDGSGFLDRYTREDIVTQQKASYRGYAYEEPLLWISPVPTQAKVIKAYGVFRPTRMTADDHTPSTPQFGNLADEFHPTVVTYALWKAGEYTEHEQSGGGERWRVQYEGQNGDGGELAKIRRILTKRVTPKGMRRRDPTGQTGALNEASYYLGG
jgi:hypothetical protein